MNGAARVRHGDDLGPDAAEQARHMLTRIAEALNRHAQTFGRQAQPLGQVTGQVKAAARRRVLTPDRTAQRNRLAGDHSGRRLPLDGGVLIGHPAHDHGVGVDIGRRDIAIRPDDARESLDIGARQPLQLGLGQALGVDLHRPLAAAIGQVGHRALHRHPEGQGFDLFHRGVRVETDAALGRAARVVITTSPRQEGFARAVVHADQQPNLHRLARVFQFLQHVAVDLNMAGRLIKARQSRVENVRVGHYFSKRLGNYSGQKNENVLSSRRTGIC